MALEDLRRQLIARAQKQVGEHFSSTDAWISKNVSLLQDLDEAFNLLCEHAKDLYSLHFPELVRMVPDNLLYCKLVLGVGNRSNFSAEKVSQFHSNPSAVQQIVSLASQSMGGEMSSEAEREVQFLCQNVVYLQQQREELQTFVERQSTAYMPNLSELASPLLAAKLLAKAGSLKHLAFMPSSALQLLGAEKAMFRHLKEHALPPKYGLLFQHSFIQQLPSHARGDMARSLSGKLSIAAKQDFFGKKLDAAGLQKSLEFRFESLKQKPFKAKPKPVPRNVRPKPFQRKRFHGKPFHGKKRR